MNAVVWANRLLANATLDSAATRYGVSSAFVDSHLKVEYLWYGALAERAVMRLEGDFEPYQNPRSPQTARRSV